MPHVKDETTISTKAAHRRWWQSFEVVFGIPFLAAIALQQVVPLALPSGFLAPAIVPAGVICIVVGALLIILARRQFSQHNQTTEPGHPTSRLITTGVFSISRNPLYLGGITILVGIALALDLPWVLIVLLPTLAICYAVLVTPEERYLASTFGTKYHTYAASVHRWIGRSRQRK